MIIYIDISIISTLIRVDIHRLLTHFIVFRLGDIISIFVAPIVGNGCKAWARSICRVIWIELKKSVSRVDFVALAYHPPRK